ncbi:MAG: hypothetical protein JXQ85_09460 [Cognatishimia sp.]|uniref:hypothetical protein n=1 Tax=Cognatishimia sp. TaxID=2211648 RepID=UPI003B8C9509
MKLSELITCCLRTDPNIAEGDYTVLFSDSKSGALNAGVLLFTASNLPKATIDAMEYRLVSILMLLVNLEDLKAESGSEKDFQLHFTSMDRASSKQDADTLASALNDRGIAAELAHELVNGRPNFI